MSEWAKIWVEFDRLVKNNADFDSPTIENARDFLMFASESYRAADAINRGYWPTICVSWSADISIEIEIFSDRYELYLSADRQLDIQAFPHFAKQPMPDALVSQLVSLAGIQP